METLLRVCFAGALVFGFAIGGLAATEPRISEIQVGDLRIQDPHISLLPSTARYAPVFMAIFNDGAVADRLLGVTTSRSQRSRLMTMEVQDNLMRMVPVTQFIIASSESLEFNALVKHVVLLDLNGPLVDGDIFTMVLKFANAGEVEVDVTVVPSTIFH